LNYRRTLMNGCQGRGLGGNLVNMKYLLALFLVAMALQPIDLQGCAMDDGEQASHHASMQHDSDSCCDPDTDQKMQDCDGAVFCSFLSAGLAVIPPSSAVAAPPVTHRYCTLNAQRYSGPPARKLFKPPIA
jgi:hypothetical protein